MSANQIMIPIALIILGVLVGYLVVRNRRIARRKAAQIHSPNAPANGHDKGAIARSAMHGLGTGGSV